MNDNKILDPIGVCFFGIGIGKENRLSIRKAAGYLGICSNIFYFLDFLKKIKVFEFESLLRFRSKGVLWNPSPLNREGNYD